MIDANLNRAREALRVMEDIARFMLDDGELSGQLKAARHELRAIVETAGLDSGLLALSRNTVGDVGQTQTTVLEMQRSGLREVAIAAGKRAGEAMRVLEEILKTVHPTASGKAKTLRYTIYDLERTLTIVLGAMDAPAARQWRLCVLITESLCLHHPWQRVCEMAIAGGADCLQLREKTLDAGALLERAWWMVQLVARDSAGQAGQAGRAGRAGRASIIVNDRPDVALAAGADGVHLGQTDLPVKDARGILGFGRVIGVSTSNLFEAQTAARDGADYCGVGPMFPTSTKHKPSLSGPAYLQEYLAHMPTGRMPHLAIGGITQKTIGAIVKVGGRGVAVSSAVCGSPDPAEACRELLSELDADAPVPSKQD